MNKARLLQTNRSADIIKISGDINEISEIQPIRSVDYMYFCDEDTTIKINDEQVDVYNGDIIVRAYDYLGKNRYPEKKLVVIRNNDGISELISIEKANKEAEEQRMKEGSICVGSCSEPKSSC